MQIVVVVTDLTFAAIADDLVSFVEMHGSATQ